MLRGYRAAVWPRQAVWSLRQPAFPRNLSTSSESSVVDDGPSEPPLTKSIASRRTIYALSTPPGKAGVAVIRVSGPSAPKVRMQMVRRTGSWSRKEYLKSAVLHRCEVLDPRDGEVIDDGLVVFFKAPFTFTGEHIIEFHVHSSPAVISRILSAFSSFRGLRPAERGEFTRRAFENGKIDLTQAEALRDLIESETEVQRKAARRGTSGETKEKYDAMRLELLSALSKTEALIDFGEGEHIEEGVWAQAREITAKLRDDIARHLSPSRRGEVLTNGVSLVIFGPPNAGKSSLLNFLAQREAAIVTHIPGTTRDVVEVALDISGWRVKVRDTAGLRESSDVVETIGVQRAEEAVQQADLGVCVLSLPELVESKLRVPDMVRKHLKSNTIVLLNKVDEIDPDKRSELVFNLRRHIRVDEIWPISVLRGDGMSELPEKLGNKIQETYDFSEEEERLVTNARHRAHLEAIVGFLNAALAYGQEDVVLVAEELRYAAEEIGKISGSVTTNDVLDAMFRDFCIGK
ncbi:tRNA modification GTPase TrmE [Calocera viscosa TUFC12733]|uniref:tRNA modification GTPase TrmE n=1 Tax=Calocera viscosa (strain TUFC12733) TaxID=1330018 RepID=A0A167QP88_CALVF|nr:tRNA modification GTPase TrmE [Calocera viscosa TUFC12733]